MWIVNRERNRRILELLEKHRYLNVEMIAFSLFRFKSGKVKASGVLKKMYDRGLVNRFRVDGGFVYCLGKKSDKWRHWEKLNRVHFEMIRQNVKILYYDFEVDYKFGRADGLYCVESLGGRLKFFLEVDTGGEMDKLDKYEKYMRSLDWQNGFVGDPLGNGKVSFPVVVILSDRNWGFESEVVFKVGKLEIFLEDVKKFLFGL